MSIIARHAVVHGRVQGVFFRAWATQNARSRGLTGWVRNRANGDVELFIHGQSSLVEQFMTLLWDGPPSARVDGINVREEAVSSHRDFEQRPTM